MAEAPGEPGNGRDQLGARVAGQEVMLRTRDLLTILLLLSGVLGGYLLYTAVDVRINHLEEQHRHLDVLVDKHTQTLLSATYEQRAFIVTQLGEQRAKTDAYLQTVVGALNRIRCLEPVPEERK